MTPPKNSNTMNFLKMLEIKSSSRIIRANRLNLNQMSPTWYQRERLLEFKNRDVDKIDDAALVEDRIQSLELRLALRSLNVPKALQKRIQFNNPLADKPPKYIMLKESENILECPVCLGRSNIHPAAKGYTYARKDTLQRHFKTHKLPKNFSDYFPIDISPWLSHFSPVLCQLLKSHMA